MDRRMKRVLTTVLGMVVTLAWWSIRGHDSNVTTTERIPETVWGGGGGKLTIEVHSTCPAQVHVSFNENQEDGQEMETREGIEAGTRSWTIDVPRGVGGYIDFTAVEPHVGDKLSWKILRDGEVLDEQSDELSEPLQQGYAFGLTSNFEDYSTGQLSED